MKEITGDGGAERVRLQYIASLPDVEEDLLLEGDETYILRPLASRRVTAQVVKTQIAPFRFVDEDVPTAVWED